MQSPSTSCGKSTFMMSCSHSTKHSDLSHLDQHQLYKTDGHQPGRWGPWLGVNFLWITDFKLLWKTYHILQVCKQSYLCQCNILSALHLTGNKQGALYKDQKKCTNYNISIQELHTDLLTVQQCKKVKLSLFLIKHHTMKVYGWKFSSTPTLPLC